MTTAATIRSTNTIASRASRAIIAAAWVALLVGVCGCAGSKIDDDFRTKVKSQTIGVGIALGNPITLGPYLTTTFRDPSTSGTSAKNGGLAK